METQNQISYQKVLFIFAIICGFMCLTIGIKANPKEKESIDNSSTLQLLVARQLFEKLNCSALSFDAFYMAWHGFIQLKASKQLKIDSILTIIDFSKPSNQERLVVINTNQWKVVLHSLVAHGRNSGDLFANTFSNTVSSFQSSLGVYVTGNTYQGKHGYSLQINGIEKGINDKALERAVVIHGADYVSEAYAKNNGRIGRSHGCPAVSYEISKTFIDLIKNGTCLFQYHPSYSKMNGMASLPTTSNDHLIAQQ